MGVRGRLQAELHRATLLLAGAHDQIWRVAAPKPRGSAYGLATNSPAANGPAQAHVFGSNVCREAHFRMPLYRFWCERLAETPRYHRKQWEWVYICQVLHEHGLLRAGARGLGFGVGKEPLAAAFANLGVEVLATDMDVAAARSAGWLGENQHAGEDVAVLNGRGLCDPVEFAARVHYRSVDMNAIPADLAGYDFCWSSCAYEHLGSIDAGLAFVRRSVDCLRPGGIAVHTTEFRLGRGRRTLESGAVVLFRRSDFEQLAAELALAGHRVAPLDFETGHEPVERYVDHPPFADEPHLRLRLPMWFGGYRTTSIGIVVERSAGTEC
jgi:SAM-dependent methyltransferase